MFIKEGLFMKRIQITIVLLFNFNVYAQGYLRSVPREKVDEKAMCRLIKLREAEEKYLDQIALAEKQAAEKKQERLAKRQEIKRKKEAMRLAKKQS